MKKQAVDVLPPRIRERVRKARAGERACRTGFALVVVAAVAAAAAELARSDALDRRDRLEAMADAGLKSCEARDRLRGEVVALAERVRVADTVSGRLPASMVLSAIANALPPGGRLDRIDFRDRGDVLEAEVQGVSNDLATVTAFAASLAATRPFDDIALDERPSPAGGRHFTMRFTVPLDKRFAVAFEEEVSDAP